MSNILKGRHQDPLYLCPNFQPGHPESLKPVLGMHLAGPCNLMQPWFLQDEQRCYLVYGSWTYNAKEVQLDWYNGKDQVELNDYSFSGIWDIMEVPGTLDMDRKRITFMIRIRRKTLFYTVSDCWIILRSTLNAHSCQRISAAAGCCIIVA